MTTIASQTESLFYQIARAKSQTEIAGLMLQILLVEDMDERAELANQACQRSQDLLLLNKCGLN